MAPTTAKSVLIVDDNASIRQALCGLFEGESDFEVCGEAEKRRTEKWQLKKLRSCILI
jgi:chemotaxis response regulator CheB